MATDGSKHATAALTAAATMLATENREIDLMYVIPPIHPKRRTELGRLTRRAERILQKSQDVLTEAGVDVTTVTKIGSPIGTLIGASYSYDITLISASSHRADSMVGLGPVAGRVAEHASGCVLIAREGRNETGLRILAAVDGSDGSLRALDKLAELIDLSGADIMLQHVAETPWLHEGPDQEWLGYEEEVEEENDLQAQLEKEFLKEADSILATACERMPAKIGVNTMVSQGLPADEILGEASRGEYDLIVLGTSGATDLKHQLLGSVSSKVAWNAPCSVLLVHPAGAQ